MIKLSSSGERVDIVGYCGNCIPALFICRIFESLHLSAFFRSELIDDARGQEINDGIARLERMREDGEL